MEVAYKYDVFFSYGHDSHKTLIDSFAHDLKQSGIKVWIDHSHIRESDDWRVKIMEGILESRTVVSFMSKHAFWEKGVCHDELMIATGLKGSLIQAVLLEKDAVVPNVIQFHQIIDLTDWDSGLVSNYDEWYRIKLDAIKSFVTGSIANEYSKELAELQELIQPDLHPLKKARMGKQFYQDRNWLNARVQQISSQNNQGILILGSPGSGKSMFMAHEYLYLKSYNAVQTKENTINVVIFCDWQDANYNRPKAILMNLIFYLSVMFSDYRKIVIGSVKKLQKIYGADFLVNLTEEELTTDLIAKPFQTMMIDGHRPTINILIDGLDEVRTKTKSGDNSLAVILSSLIRDLPAWVHILVTSRKDIRILNQLKNTFEVIDLDSAGKENIEEAVLLIRRLLGEGKSTQSENVSDHVILKIAEISKGNFLYASLLTKALQNDYLDIEELNTLPSELKDFYKRIFDRCFDSQDLDYEDGGYSKLFEVLAATPQPIPERTLSEVMGWDFREIYRKLGAVSICIDTEIDKIGAPCYRLFHKSLADWLHFHEAGRYRTDEETGYRYLAAACWERYRKAASGRRRRENKNKLNEYELEYLIPFLEEAYDEEHLEIVMQDAFHADCLIELSQKYKQAYAYEKALTLISQAAKIYTCLVHNMDPIDPSSPTFKSFIKTSCETIRIAHFLAKNETVLWHAEDFEEQICRLPESCLDIKDMNQVGWINMYYAYNLFRSGSDQQIKLANSKYEEAIHCFEQSNDMNGIMQCTQKKAEMLRLKHTSKEALEFWEKKNQLYHFEKFASTYPSAYSGCLRIRIWCQMSRDKIHVSESFRQLDEFHLKYKDLISENDLGRLDYLHCLYAYQKRDWDICMAYAKSGLRHLENQYGLHSVEICDILNQLNSINLKLYRENNDSMYVQDAVEYSWRSYEIRRSHYSDHNMLTTNSLERYVEALIAIGTVSALEKAEEYIQKIIAIRREFTGLKDIPRLASALKTSAAIHQKRNELTLAEEELQYAIGLYTESDQKGEQGVCMKELGRIQIMKENHAQAVNIIEQALNLLQEAFSPNHGAVQEAKKLLDFCQTRL